MTEPPARPAGVDWRLLKQPVHLFALGFGSGLSPIAPGTCGSLVALPIYLLLVQLPLWVYSLVLVAMILFGVWVCDRSAARLGVRDHPAIVWDEVCGLLLALWGLPVTWLTLAVGFVLFRGLDILKPWPIGWLDKRIPGGLGIMLDDIVAGAMALALGLGIKPWL